MSFCIKFGRFWFSKTGVWGQLGRRLEPDRPQGEKSADETPGGAISAPGAPNGWRCPYLCSTYVTVVSWPWHSYRAAVSWDIIHGCEPTDIIHGCEPTSSFKNVYIKKACSQSNNVIQCIFLGKINRSVFWNKQYMFLYISNNLWFTQKDCVQ